MLLDDAGVHVVCEPLVDFGRVSVDVLEKWVPRGFVCCREEQHVRGGKVRGHTARFVSMRTQNPINIKRTIQNDRSGVRGSYIVC